MMAWVDILPITLHFSLKILSDIYLFFQVNIL